MTRKRQRLIFVLSGLAALGLATGLTLHALRDNLVFFYSPTQVVQHEVPVENRNIRIGGLVSDGSVQRPDANTIRFTITDMVNTVNVTYTGLTPNLFKEGKGVVAEGRLGPDGTFLASQVLAKHDETYMPKEVIDALKAAGQWKGN
ncbi:MAG: cytochrome c maturation protein CcmE [Alphaproteobacteria bacterium]|nr:cytochrome c maturation protein CcmE [Alphaproteobacteria bacterium]